MNDDLTRQYQRWQEAEDAGREDVADAACKAMFAGVVQEPRTSSDFVARTLSSIARATEADAARARRMRHATIAGGVAAAAGGIYVGGPWFLSVLSATLVGLINMLVGATVQVAGGMQTGVDVWSVLAGLGRAAVAFVADPAVTVAMIVMQGIAMAALFALQRLLGSDRESLK
ncbi:MAG: hypothetical protein ACRD15_01915 [Vicinamibacterales bacterium]